MSKTNRYLLGTIIIVFLFFSFLCIFKIIKLPALVYFNSSPSLPVGVYVRVPLKNPLERDGLVVVKVPKEMHKYIYGRNWLKKNTPLLKMVYALPGDTYTISDEAIFVNGEFVGEIYRQDKTGLPLPEIRGTFTVKEGYFLPMSARYPDSFDGRYFGQISQNEIIAEVKPLFIFPNWLEVMNGDS